MAPSGRDHRQSFTSWTLSALYFFWGLPVFLVLMFIGNTYVFVDVFFFSLFLSRSPVNSFTDVSELDSTAALAVFCIYLFLLVYTAGCISTCWYITNTEAKTYQTPFFRDTRRKVVQTIAAAQSDFTNLPDIRPNLCQRPPYAPRCANGQVFRGDRMYHCREYSRCLPGFDHYCFWLWCPVYFGTMKSYALFIPSLFVYAVYSVAAMSWAISEDAALESAKFTYAFVALSGLFAAWAAFHNTIFQWRMIVFKNRVGSERSQREFGDDQAKFFRMAIRLPNGTWHLDNVLVKNNPYSQGGWWDNAQEVLGRWYQIPFFWWQPDRVAQYGPDAEATSDTTLSPLYLWKVSRITQDHQLRESSSEASLTIPPQAARRRTNRSSSIEAAIAQV